ncbi:hypothetical protein LMG31506_05363 [Cupriavidus yeoncheonensis]|uniref:Uncharacterized protein n=1 Tax=Cupriavidus yeoncheonensis TaxID=1462994 RepID=A0A916J215_9BURK|nr:hypothetical protein LMG31506_05363 [Cupriavidus yeoncheonensis]
MLHHIPELLAGPGRMEALMRHVAAKLQYVCNVDAMLLAVRSPNPEMVSGLASMNHLLGSGQIHNHPRQQIEPRHYALDLSVFLRRMNAATNDAETIERGGADASGQA